MGLIYGTNPEAYHVIYNGTEVGYVEYNGKTIHTFYKQGPMWNQYPDGNWQGGEHTKSLTIYPGKPQKTYSTAGTTINYWIGASFINVRTPTGTENTSVNKQTTMWVDSSKADGCMAMNSTLDTVKRSAMSTLMTFNSSGMTPAYLGVFQKSSQTSAFSVDLHWAYMGPCMMTWDENYQLLSGGSGYVAGPTNLEIHNGNNVKLKHEEYLTYDEAEAASNLDSYDEYISSINKDVSTSNFWGKGGNFWIPAATTYKPQDYGFWDESFYKLNAPWTRYHIFYFYDSKKKLHKRKPIQMHFPNKSTGGSGGGSNPCLKQNTLITMADGSQKTIQNIKPGEEILGYDFAAGKTIPSIVLTSQMTGKHTECVCMIFSNGESIHMTEGHNLYSVKYGRYLPIETFTEGDKVLSSNGDVVEILVIQRHLELKTREQFWHIVSSNNTYFANNIMNANHPIDKYRFLHDINQQTIEAPIEEVIMDEAKDAGCFEFTTTNTEFVKIATKYQTIIKKATVEIDDCNREIEKLNLLIPRVFVPQQIKNQYPVELEQRTQLYKRIAELKKNIQDAQNNYNSLLIDYSDLGEDIMLPDPERREKYFKRANKIANDNFTLYQEYYPYIE